MRSAILVAAAAVLVTSSSAKACRCVVPTVEAALKLADAVIVGEVVAIASDVPSEIVYDVSVDRSMKGAAQGAITVRSTGTCRYELRPGDTRVLFLRALDTADFHTNICSGNLDAAQADTLAGAIGHEVVPVPTDAPAD